MAKVVFEWMEPSIPFQKRTLYLEENQPILVKRASPKENESENNAVFNCSVVSSKHCHIGYTKGQFYVEDLSSSNGTFVNGPRVIPNVKHIILSGDVLEFGTNVFNFNASKLVAGIVVFVKLFPPEEEDPAIWETLKKEYPHVLQLYSNPPLIEYELEPLLRDVWQRLKVLQIISRIGDFDMQNDKWVHTVTKQLRENGMSDFCDLIMGTVLSSKTEYHLRKRDHVSHFVLEVACSRLANCRHWFINQEIKLFIIRWHFLSPSDRRIFLKLNNLVFKKISKEKRKELVVSSQGFISEKEEYFEISYITTTELIKKRAVYLEGGLAYLTLEQLVFPITTFFQSSLSFKMMFAKNQFPSLEKDERIMSLIKEVEEIARYRITSLHYKKRIRMSVRTINQLSIESYPLCMERLHYYLCREKHLRHGGRFQYNLFLKGIGVPLNDALLFWQHYFTKSISHKQFQSRYSYHIRHNYGEVGKLADYPPMNCDKIFKAVPGPLDHHGCPFKTEPPHVLTRILALKGLSPFEVSQICDKVEEGTPRLACAKYFEYTHGQQLDWSNGHPNMYFFESRKLLEGKVNGSNASSSKCSPKSSITCLCSDKKYDW